MIAIDKDRLETNLHAIAQFYCSYKAKLGGLCDCKFMMEDEHHKKLSYGHEQFCGCPEIKTVLLLLQAMTKKQYNDLVKKVERKQQIAYKKRLVEIKKSNKPLSHVGLMIN